MIKLVEICEIANAVRAPNHKYTLREIYVNPKHVISLKEELNYKQKLKEGTLPENLNLKQQFTRVTLDKGHTGLEVVVVGSPDIINSKLNGDTTHRVLKG